MKTLFFASLIWLLSSASAQLHAQDIPPPAYQIAAIYMDIPSTVLYAIALQESGRSVNGKLRPWPWTLNIAGRGYYFESQDAACNKLTVTLRSISAKRVDVGLGQINVGYHGHRVSKPCDLLNPYLNLSVAGKILTEQHRPGQDWLITMGKYHSPANGSAAAKYRASVQRHLRQVQSNRRMPSKIIVSRQ
jgi:soluble lytic murein transglycosylase-like protein